MPFNVRLRGSVTINRLLPSAIAQHLILNEKNVEGNALQGQRRSQWLKEAWVARNRALLRVWLRRVLTLRLWRN